MEPILDRERNEPGRFHRIAYALHGRPRVARVMDRALDRRWRGAIWRRAAIEPRSSAGSAVAHRYRHWPWRWRLPKQRCGRHGEGECLRLNRHLAPRASAASPISSLHKLSSTRGWAHPSQLSQVWTISLPPPSAETATPSIFFRQHFAAVETPAVDAKNFRTTWNIRTRLGHSENCCHPFGPAC